jgi:hypothetical protein
MSELVNANLPCTQYVCGFSVVWQWAVNLFMATVTLLAPDVVDRTGYAVAVAGRRVLRLPSGCLGTPE